MPMVPPPVRRVALCRLAIGADSTSGGAPRPTGRAPLIAGGALSVLSGALSITGLALLPSTAHAEDRRLFLFVTDGARASEMADADFPYCPAMWGTYLPQGSLVEMLENRDSTYTDAAHREITSAHRQPTSGIAWDDDHLLAGAMFPTVFEEYARQKGVPADAGYVVGNTVFMDNQGASIYPGMQGFGAPTKADHEVSALTDNEVLPILQDHLDATANLRVVLWNIHNADKLGHRANQDGYRGNLTQGDLALDTFVRTRGDPTRDVYFAFADHGRHDNTHWKDHGDSCAGCRNSYLLAWGAGVKGGGQRIPDGWELQDLAVTAAWLLGIEMPSAHGRLITPLLESPPPAPAIEDALVDPTLAATADGAVHMAATRLPWDADGGALLYRHSPGDGTWDAWTSVTTWPDTVTPEDTRLYSLDDQLILTWRAYHLPTRMWGAYAARSTDGGMSWARPEQIDDEVFHFYTPNMVVDPATGTLQSVAWSSASPHTKDPAAFTWVTGTAIGWSSVESQGSTLVHLPLECQLALPDGDPVAVCAGIMDVDYPHPEDGKGSGDTQNRELLLLRNFTDGGTPEITQITDDPSVSFWPSLVTDDAGVLHLAWAERTTPLDLGGWSVWYTTSADHGASWSTPVQVDEGGAEAWRPTVLLTSVGPAIGYTEVDGATHRAKIVWVEGDTLYGRVTLGEEAEAVIDAVRLAEIPGTTTVVATWNVGRSTLVHEVHDAWIIEPDGPPPDDTGDTGEDSGIDSGDTGEDSGIDSGDSEDTRADSGGEDGGKGTGCGCTTSGDLRTTAVGLGLLALALTRRRGRR